MVMLLYLFAIAFDFGAIKIFSLSSRLCRPPAYQPGAQVGCNYLVHSWEYSAFEFVQIQFSKIFKRLKIWSFSWFSFKSFTLTIFEGVVENTLSLQPYNLPVKAFCALFTLEAFSVGPFVAFVETGSLSK